MVARNSATTPHAPRWSRRASPDTVGRAAGTAVAISAAGTSQLTSAGRNSARKAATGTFPFCHTMSVVMSPKGENTPPALAATTMLIMATVTKRGCPAPTLSATVPMTSAVVRLSATGEMQNASAPVIQ